MATKYIVNNVSGQTITGDLTINGNVIITGTSSSNSIATYRALLTQTGSQVATNLDTYNGKLIIGETYTITNYDFSADFSNIANVISGDINQTGCVFVATGATPNSWTDSTELTSGGGLIVDVLENTLGYDIDWSIAPFGGYGYYIGVNDTTGPIINSFPRNTTEIKLTPTQPLNWPAYPAGLDIWAYTGGFMISDDSLIGFTVWNWDVADQTNDGLYYTPIEINIKQDLDVTPIVLSGSVTSSYPIYNPSVRIYCNDSIMNNFYATPYTVNDLAELVNYLNSDTNTNVLGTYSYDAYDNIFLTMKTNLKNQYCPNGTLTFEAFND
jgi:hypothetical protein